MDNSKFSILDAIKDAYLFLGREWPYLLKVGIPAVILQIVIGVFVQLARGDAGMIESYLWSLPAAVLFAWFAFLEVRLLLLGERIDTLPKDPAYLRDRQQSIRVSVLTSLVFNMAMTATLGVLVMITYASTNPGASSATKGLGMVTLLIIALIIWGVRFSVLPILGAVQYPFSGFLQRVAGAMFSLRLLGLGFMALFPVAIVFHGIFLAVLGDAANPDLKIKLTEGQQMAVMAIGAVMSLCVSMVLNAAGAFALKQILGRTQKDVTA